MSWSRGPRNDAVVVFTIGHSTRAIAEFIRLLQAHGVQRVIDAREITSGLRTRRHALTSFARVSGTRVMYPAPQRS